MRRPTHPKYMRDFFMRRYGSIFPVAQTASGHVVRVGDSLRSIVDPTIVRKVVCFFYDDRDEIGFGFVSPEDFDPTAAMWSQEAALSKYEPA